MQDIQKSWRFSWASSEILHATIASLQILTSTIFLRDITLCTVQDSTPQSVINQTSIQDLAVGPPCRRSHADTNTRVTKWNEGRFYHSQGRFVVHLSKHNDVITLYSTYGMYYQVFYYTNYLRGSRSLQVYSLRRRSAAVWWRLPVRISLGVWMFVCCVCCVLSM